MVTAIPDLTVDEQVAEWAGDLCVLPPLDLCGESSPKGNWRCVRAPHDNDNHVFAGWVET